jgi:hypothetical protein
MLQLQTRLLVMLFIVITFGACSKKDISSPEKLFASQVRNDQRNDQSNGHLKQTKTFSSDVVKKWLTMQTSMLYRPSGNPFGLNPGRYMAYSGVALYESVLPGMPAYQSLYGQLTNMPVMPATKPGFAYHWPSSAHAALATMTKNFFSTTAAYNPQAVTNLEIELNTQYRAEAGDVLFERSVAFGKEVALRIFEWSRTDNANLPTIPYQLPTPFPGMWQPETVGGPNWLSLLGLQPPDGARQPG